MSLVVCAPSTGISAISTSGVVSVVRLVIAERALTGRIGFLSRALSLTDLMVTSGLGFLMWSIFNYSSYFLIASYTVSYGTSSIIIWSFSTSIVVVCST